MTFRPVPKPVAKTDREKRVEKIVRAWSKKKVWRQRAIDRDRAKPRTPVKKINTRATKRRHERYEKLIRSDFNLRLRYERYVIAQGYCECERCVSWREKVNHAERLGGVFRTEDAGEIGLAITRPDVWFTRSGSEPHKRFRSKAGDLHHLRYGRTEREDPRAIADVRWMHKICHERIESQFGTRRRFLHGRS